MTAVIDYETWPRRGHYEFFKPMSNPFYSLTFPVDVTGLRAWCRGRGLSFYHSLVYAVTKSMEEVEAFRVRERDGVILRHDRLIPSFTDLRPGEELFRIVTLEAGEDPEDFCRRAGELARSQREFITRGDWAEDELVYFTCLPWFPITSLTNERDMVPGDPVPRVAWGRYEEKDGRYVLSMSLELNHRLLDGNHVGQFHRALTVRLEALS